MSPEVPDPYVVLGVGRRASPDEIARAYRRAARLTHPDSGDSGGASDRFRLVSDAYEVLRDPGRRAGYDRLHPFRRQEAGPVVGRSVRYAAPGSERVVLGAWSPPAAGPGIAAGMEFRTVRAPGDLEELLALVRSLLRGGW